MKKWPPSALHAAQAGLAMQEVLKKEQFANIQVLGEVARAANQMRHLCRALFCRAHWHPTQPT